MVFVLSTGQETNTKCLLTHNLESIIVAQAREAKEASRVVRMLSTDIKNKALHAMADALVSERVCILSANQKNLAVFDVIESSAMRMVWKKALQAAWQRTRQLCLE